MQQTSVMPALVLVVLVGSALPALTNEPNPAAKAAAVRTGAGAKPQAKTAAPAVPDLRQRRRRSIAELLERHHYFRGLISGGAAKIVDAKLAGPFEGTKKRLFLPETSTETMYCATAKLMVPIPAYLRALIRVEHPPGAGERMLPAVNYRADFEECRNADYKPFPEMEQLRVQRRRTLGHAD